MKTFILRKWVYLAQVRFLIIVEYLTPIQKALHVNHLRHNDELQERLADLNIGSTEAKTLLPVICEISLTEIVHEM